ncbi:MAG TPA: hypothetical protein VFM10_08800, partial [Terriglobales bacterium]|nr:hypothetical protein [Terriglobales bacterium]
MRAENYRGSVLNLALAVTALVALIEPSSAATVTSYAGDQAGFEAATTTTTIPLPVNTTLVPQKTVTNAYLNMTFTSGAICNPINGDLCDIFFGDFTPRVAGNEFGMSGQEDFTIDLSQKVLAFGFNIFQPGFLGAQGCNSASCVDDTFRISIYNGGTLLRTIDYKPPTDDGVSEVVALGFF